tara:strand:- start:155 stop:310 length:156 start_codon:yes stop_codon:yes gene_type:complete
MPTRKFKNDVPIIVGFGCVDLPLGIMLALKKLKVSLNDINNEIIKKIFKKK